MREAILVETVTSRPRHLFELFLCVRWDQHEHVRALSVARHGYGDRCSWFGRWGIFLLSVWPVSQFWPMEVWIWYVNAFSVLVWIWFICVFFSLCGYDACICFLCSRPSSTSPKIDKTNICKNKYMHVLCFASLLGSVSDQFKGKEIQKKSPHSFMFFCSFRGVEFGVVCAWRRYARMTLNGHYRVPCSLQTYKLVYTCRQICVAK